MTLRNTENHSLLVAKGVAFATRLPSARPTRLSRLLLASCRRQTGISFRVGRQAKRSARLDCHKVSAGKRPAGCLAMLLIR